MTDIDAKHRATLTQFGVYQMTHNPAGIGNECTHWVYAALFEARALDNDRRLHIAQSGIPYTWGRAVTPDAAQRGDITQFRNFTNAYFIYEADGSGGWSEKFGKIIRGPDHTGMVFVPPRSGRYFQLESHLHGQLKNYPVMKIRGNTIYIESFAVALSADDLKGLKGTPAWRADIDTSNIDDMIDYIDWPSMRGQFSIPMARADALVARIKKNDLISKQNEVLVQRNRNPMPTAPIEVDGKQIAFLFVMHTTGDLRFYCPQQSQARLDMSDSQLADEKTKVISGMIRGGRAGDGHPDEDQYFGDNKKPRVQSHYFDWSFPPQP